MTEIIRREPSQCDEGCVRFERSIRLGWSDTACQEGAIFSSCVSKQRVVLQCCLTKRDTGFLQDWLKSRLRLPLVIRGASQVGKTLLDVSLAHGFQNTPARRGVPPWSELSPQIRIIPFFLVPLTMHAVGKAAFEMINEIRRQFREISGFLEGTAKPDTTRCVDIATTPALKKMVLPGVIAVAAPPVVGFLKSAEALGGMLAGALLGCVLLALSLGQRQEVRREGPSRRQGIRHPHRDRGRRHRRRPLQGHLWTLDEHPHQCDGDRESAYRAAALSRGSAGPRTGCTPRRDDEAARECGGRKRPSTGPPTN